MCITSCVRQLCSKYRSPDFTFRTVSGNIKIFHTGKEYHKDSSEETVKLYNEHYRSGDLLEYESREQNAGKKHKSTEILYGIHPVNLALESKRRTFYCLYHKPVKGNSRISSIIHKCKDLGIDVVPHSVKQLNRLAEGTHVHQGICAQVTPLPVKEIAANYMLEQTETKQPSLTLLVDRLQDPMNLGAVLRTCYFLGVDDVITVQGNSCPITAMVSKASSGAAEVMDLKSISLQQLSGFLSSHLALGWEVVASVPPHHPQGSQMPLYDFSLRKNTILIIGSESSGVDPRLQELCTHLVFIPAGRELHSGIESLNVSAAAALLIYRLLGRSRE